jgi:hypothetical protein
MSEAKKPLKILVTGGREYAEKEKVWEALDAVHRKSGIAAIVHGDARGADTLAKEWALERKIDHIPYPADWDKYKKGARPIRNQKMLDREKPDAVVAFPGNDGTADMIKRSMLAGLQVWQPYLKRKLN